MTDLPSPIPAVLAVANSLVVLFAAGVVGLAIWAIRGDLPRDLRSRYPRRTIFMSQLPFTEEWRAAIARDDLPAFLTNRRRGLALTLAGFILLYALTGCGYVHAVADLYRCQVGKLQNSRQRALPTHVPQNP